MIRWMCYKPASLGKLVSKRSPHRFTPCGLFRLRIDGGVDREHARYGIPHFGTHRQPTGQAAHARPCVGMQARVTPGPSVQPVRSARLARHILDRPGSSCAEQPIAHSSMNVTWSAGAKRRCYSYGCAVVITEGSEAAASRARSSPVVLWRAKHKGEYMGSDASIEGWDDITSEGEGLAIGGGSSD